MALYDSCSNSTLQVNTIAHCRAFQHSNRAHLRDIAVPLHVVPFPAFGLGVRAASPMSDDGVYLDIISHRSSNNSVVDVHVALGRRFQIFSVSVTEEIQQEGYEA